MAEIWAACWDGLGARRQASIWYQLPGVPRGIRTVMVSVAPRDAHQPPLALVSKAGRPAMVVFGLGGWKLGKPAASQRTRTPPGGSGPTGSVQFTLVTAGLWVTVQGSCCGPVLRYTINAVKLDVSFQVPECQVAG